MGPLRILLIGSGGREHALAWKLSQSPRVDAIWVAPGNGGTTDGIPKVQNVPLKVDDFPGIIRVAQENKVNLVVPGPEVPLVAGITDACREAGLRCFGPTKEAARIEGSKVFAKGFMKKYGIPTAKYESFTSFEKAKEYVEKEDFKPVIKATGLAAGKGVIIPETKEEAIQALENILVKKEFGDQGDEVVIEEFLEGEELSILSFCDGYTIRSLPPAQDHKQSEEGDKGPMTGGMGCYAPTRLATPKLIEEINRTVLEPTMAGMRKERMPFVGLLFTGLMITKEGKPKVLEYNVRFGDPETETLLPLLSSDTDLAELMIACTEGWLEAATLNVEKNLFSVCIIVVAEGYPGSYKKGNEITIGQAAKPPTAVIFHAGTALNPEAKLVTSGGRVIACTATGPSIQAALDEAKKAVACVSFAGAHHRRDIGHRALKPAAGAEQTPLTYAAAGVDVDAGNKLVQLIKPAVASTRRPGTEAAIGGFGGLFDLHAAGFPSGSPRLVLGIDGVGTKLELARRLRAHHAGVGVDCVAMSVNDLVVQGAEPLAFLDCFTCGALDVDVARQFVEGVAEGCRLAGCALVGGETAEMPGLFAQQGSAPDGHQYDAVGAAVGALQEGQAVLPDTESMVAGDALLGLTSSGCHSNGFSLVRRILDRAGVALTDAAPWAAGGGVTAGEALLTPTRIYVKPLLRLARARLVKGMAHITGGGLTDNVPRMLPPQLAAQLDARVWDLPPVMRWLKAAGGVADEELARTLNTGLGMVLVVAQDRKAEAIRILEEEGETVKEVGKLVESTGEPRCVTLGMKEAWNPKE